MLLFKYLSFSKTIKCLKKCTEIIIEYVRENYLFLQITLKHRYFNCEVIIKH